ncbi:DUF3574 domain-containing protein [Dyella sp. C11]|uniref:DUF3574 domain-containing protein n=1 Tax=Dyella sp. C11 TaxID=2126991 RepID=UPI000D654D21|nr:DUF3574 domain-containing protein [Dyella sp. C11]
MNHLRLASAVLASALLSGCVAASRPANATLQGDPAHPGQTQGWVDTKLYFGLGAAGDPSSGVSEQRWRDFLDTEVTPRFPDGLSVLDVYGQWQGKGQSTPERLRSKLLIIDYPDGAENRAKVEAIRAAWKQKTGDQSVLRVTQSAEVSF